MRLEGLCPGQVHLEPNFGPFAIAINKSLCPCHQTTCLCLGSLLVHVSTLAHLARRLGEGRGWLGHPGVRDVSHLHSCVQIIDVRLLVFDTGVHRIGSTILLIPLTVVQLLVLPVGVGCVQVVAVDWIFTFQINFMGLKVILWAVSVVSGAGLFLTFSKVYGKSPGEQIAFLKTWRMRIFVFSDNYAKLWLPKPSDRHRKYPIHRNNL